MEKLFDLLKQHCRKRYWFKDNDDLEIDTDSVCFHLYLKWERLFPIRVETVICKEFWFIKWLDENNKIDCNKSIFTVDWDYDRDDVIYAIERQNYYILNEQYWVDSTDCILMLLSIQDEPIQFLISLLK